MADYGIAVLFVLENEDATLGGAISHDPTRDDPQAVARYGINSAAFPEAKTAGFYSMSKQDAIAYAKNFYNPRFFAPIKGACIKNQDIANKYLDMAVNMGQTQATKLMQRACNNTPGQSITVDGIPGPSTVGAINDRNPAALMTSVKQDAVSFYKEIAPKEKWSDSELESMIQRANRS